MPKLMIMFCDPEGKPRAWAVGSEGKEDEVLAEAKRQLELYRQKKREVGDPLADARFTVQRELVED